MRQLLLAAPARGVVLRVCVCDHTDSRLHKYSRILYVIDEYRIISHCMLRARGVAFACASDLQHGKVAELAVPSFESF